MSDMFYDFQEVSINVFISCYVFPCHVWQGPPLDPMELSVTLAEST